MVGSCCWRWFSESGSSQLDPAHIGLTWINFSLMFAISLTQCKCSIPESYMCHFWVSSFHGHTGVFLSCSCKLVFFPWCLFSCVYGLFQWLKQDRLIKQKLVTELLDILKIFTVDWIQQDCWSVRHCHRIIEHSLLQGTHRDHPVHLLASHRAT